MSADHNEQADIAARRLQDILDSTAEGIIGVDLDGKLTFVNQSALGILGYQNDGVLTGLKLSQTIFWTSAHTQNTTLAGQLLSQTLRQGLSTSSDEVLLYRSDGSPVPVELRCHPKHLFDAQVSGAVLTFLDVSDRKRQQRELEAAIATANTANRAKSEFIARISHELRTPLTAITGFADLLVDDISDDVSLERINVIRRNSAYLGELLDDLLEVSDVGAGQLTMRPGVFVLKELLDDVVSAASPLCVSKGLQLDVEIQSEVPELVEADRRRLKQVLDILTRNAIEFTGNGAVRLSVGSRQLDKIPAGMIGLYTKSEEFGSESVCLLQFSTENAGGGIESSFRDLVERMAGEIRITTRPENGSLLTVDVPVVRKAENALRTSRFNVTGSRQTSQQVMLPARILVADDDTDTRNYLAAAIRRCGGSVVTATNGWEAIDACNHGLQTGRAIELILMDMQMPMLDGGSAVAKLRKQGCELPIIAITAGAMRGDREQSLLFGCDDYMIKPVDIESLLQRMEHFMLNLHGAEWAARVRTHEQEHTEVSATLLPEASSSEAKSCTGEKLLVVDDHADVTAAMLMLLRVQGYDVSIATTGHDALEAIRSEQPDIVLLDISLPDKDGFEVMAELELAGLRNPSTFFVATTGHTGRAARAQAISAGFDAFVAKPVIIAELLELLRSRQVKKNP